MILELKSYQRTCLERLTEYLRAARKQGASAAFMEAAGVPYRAVDRLPGLPYVCLRVPTGGGKTLLAAHAVGIATKEFLEIENSVVLWLAPSGAIVSQTLDALRNREHPYRRALEDAFAAVEVLDVKEALYVQRGVLDSSAVVIVATLQALRVEQTEGRKVYESAGALHHHFTALTHEQLALFRNDDGTVDYSLANVLKMRRPLVIMDEAHNARTPLSFDALERFSPSAILEFTATPDERANPSNVLYSVSAAELKADSMIKLPVYLRTLPDWKQAVAAAVERQSWLEKLAREEEASTGEYLRPIVLFQAQQQSSTEQRVTWETLYEYLTREMNLREEEVLVHTGTRRDLDKLAAGEILDRKCPARFVITVQALKEGWDCPFAYVLCSVHNLSSRTAVEQILGRVLRLPGARRKNATELNHAYAFATSSSFAESARSLVDALVESGFNPFEAKYVVRRDNLSLPFEPGPEPAFEAIEEPVISTPKLDELPPILRQRVSFAPLRQELVYQGPPLSQDETAWLEKCFTNPEDRDSVVRLSLRSRGLDYWPAARGIKLAVPALALRVQGELAFFEDQFLDFSWALSECDPLLIEEEFSILDHPGQAAVVDVGEKGRLEASFVADLDRQLSLLEMRGPQSAGELALWLDRQIPHTDITISESSLFLRRMVTALVEKRAYGLEQLVRHRFRLRDAARERIDAYRKSAQLGSYAALMRSPEVCVDPRLCFEFPNRAYAANRLYLGTLRFRKHFYEMPAVMNKEEAECAQFVDSMLDVRYWCRNVDRSPYSFWLPVPSGRFFPDFVVKLSGGQILALEYKGEAWLDTADTRVKQEVGRIWEERSAGGCFFRIVSKTDYQDVMRSVSELASRNPVESQASLFE